MDDKVSLTPRAKDAVLHTITMLIYEVARQEMEISKTRIAIIDERRKQLREQFPNDFDAALAR